MDELDIRGQECGEASLIRRPLRRPEEIGTEACSPWRKSVQAVRETHAKAPSRSTPGMVRSIMEASERGQEGRDKFREAERHESRWGN